MKRLPRSETLAALVDMYAVPREGRQKYRRNFEVALVVPEVLEQPDSAFQMTAGDICLTVEPFPVSGAVGGFELVKFAVADAASSAAYYAWHEIDVETVCVSHRDAAGFLTELVGEVGMPGEACVEFVDVISWFFAWDMFH